MVKRSSILKDLNKLVNLPKKFLSLEFLALIVKHRRKIPKKSKTTKSYLHKIKDFDFLINVSQFDNRVESDGKDVVIMRTKILSFIFLNALMSLVIAGHHETSSSSANAQNAKQFFLSFLEGDLVTAKGLAHENFTFVFKGRTQISNQVQNKEQFFTDWAALVGELVPEGFTKFEFSKSVSENNSVVWFVEGDAIGINGRYDNEYVFAFEFADGKILSIAEYNSDLLVATRLYKQKLVPSE